MTDELRARLAAARARVDALLAGMFPASVEAWGVEQDEALRHALAVEITIAWVQGQTDAYREETARQRARRDPAADRCAMCTHRRDSHTRMFVAGPGVLGCLVAGCSCVQFGEHPPESYKGVLGTPLPGA